MASLASTYRDAGRFDDALRLLKEAWQRTAATAGPDHSRTVRARQVVEITGLLKTHLEQYEQVRVAKGPDDRETLLKRALVGYTLRRLHSFHAAEGHLRAVYEARRRTLGPDHAETLLVQTDVGLVLIDQHRYADAEPYLRRSLDLIAKKAPESWVRFSLMTVLGESLLGQQKFAEAEPLLLEGYAGMKRHEASVSEEFRTGHLGAALERLIHLYSAWGKEDRAEPWRKEWESLQTAALKRLTAK
jgi:hypothetical protein